ncbi:MAG: antibiotic biosynthesis monooxygenase [OCS116 cluster bacterium]|uniref:Antibiotic biosynthesis monooxygenase n=1 Tax=OCS116 cluster bacterium TaxID=2030921 RepID=A0A2A4Z1V1_9PROT|nr:antibiotic biosynthesis monooxygenase [OCS116 cluster bacterium]
MVKLVEMDEVITLAQQMKTKSNEPVTLINRFHVPAEVEEEFLERWEEDGQFMLSQGCLSGQLHKGIEGSSSYINIAVWESAAAFVKAFSNPEFQAVLASYPENISASPHLFEKIAVPGVCVA